MKKKISFVLFITIALVVAAFPASAPAASIQLSWQANSEPDLQSYNVYYGTASRSYKPPVTVTGQTSYILTGLAEDTVYYVAISATDNSGNESGYSNEATIKTAGGQSNPTTDTIAPAVEITVPTTAGSFNTDRGDLSLAGQASDANGIVDISWETDHGQRGKANGTTTWTVDGIVLSEGQNVITVRASDPSGNESIDQLTVEYIPGDVDPPVISIESPQPLQTGEPVQTAVATLALNGTATDNREVTEVRWSLNGGSGVAAGTSSWSIPAVSLQEGLNTISIQAVDGAGNTATASLDVIYSAPDTSAPTINIQTPTAATDYTTDQATISIAGQAQDDHQLSTVEWSSSSGAGGTAVGTQNWSVSSIPLVPGDNVITFTATDAAGNRGEDAISILYNGNADLVSSVSVSSGRKYEIHDHLANGDPVYIDRSYTYGLLPDRLRDSTYIMTANNDKTISGSSFLSFNISKPATVYVAHDDRITAKPDWLKSFVDTGLNLRSDVTMSIFARNYASGKVILGGNGGIRDSSMYAVVVVENTGAQTPLVLKISDLQVGSGKGYQLQKSIGDGKSVYIDRNYLYHNLPGALQGRTYIMTANDDKYSDGDRFLSFQVNLPVTVYIAHDDRITSKPPWMGGFVDTGLDLESDVTMSLFVRKFNSGTVTLGGNGGNRDTSMYAVIIDE